MFSDERSLRQLIRQLFERLSRLESELAGLRSQRDARLGHKRTVSIYKGRVTQAGGIAARGSGEVTIYKNGEATTWKVTAWFDWLADTGDDPLAFNDRVLVYFFPDENRFEVGNAEC